MSAFGRCLSVLSFAAATFVASVLSPAWAQDGPQNLDAGKSAAQLFASDCAICHKSPQGLARAGGLLGLESFLREHYTASRQSAAALAGYLKAAGDAPAPARARAKQPPKGEAKTGGGKDKKPAGGAGAPGNAATKPDEKKPAEAKPAEAKPAEAKPAEAKPVESKPADAKPAEVKPAESPPADAKPQ
jgi:hypothetical protein